MIVSSKLIGSNCDHINVLISYSRRQVKFVDRLQAALRGRCIDAKVDRSDIEKGERVWPRIKQLIIEADTIIFVLSPDSIISPFCLEEVEFAETLNKRFLPVVAVDVTGHKVPAALALLNFIFFTADPGDDASTDGFDEALDELVHALKTDIDWIREHTRLGALAERWDGRNRRNDLVLRGAELAAAETWLTKRPKDAPPPSDLHQAFITESRQAASRRQRGWLIGAGVVTAVALGLALYAWYQRGVAQDREVVARNRLVQLMIDRGRRDVRDGYLHGAWLWFAEALTTDNRTGATEVAHRRRVASVRKQLPELSFDSGPEGGGQAVRFTPDGNRLLIFAKKDQKAQVSVQPVNSDDGTDVPQATIDLGPCWVKEANFQANQPTRLVLVKHCYRDDKQFIDIEVRALSDGPPLLLRSFPDSATVQLSGDGSRLLVIAPTAAGDERLEAAVYQVATWQMLARYPLGSSKGKGVGTLSHDGRIIALLVGGRISVRAVDTAWLHPNPPSLDFNAGGDAAPDAVVLSPDGRFLLLAGGRRIEQFRIDQMVPMFTRAFAHSIEGISFSSDRCRFLISFEREDDSRYTEVWDACGQEFKQPEIVIQHETPLEQWRRALARGGAAGASAAGAGVVNPFARPAVFGPDGDKVVTISKQQRSVRVWRRSDGASITPALSLFGHSLPVVDTNPDGSRVAAVEFDRALIWRLDSIAPPRRLIPVRNRIDSLFFTPKGDQLVGAFFGGSKAVWRLDAGDTAETEFVTYSNDTSSVVYDPTNNRLVTGGFDQKVFVWDITGGALAAPVIRMPGNISALFLDASGTRLLVVSQSGDKKGVVVRLFDLPSGRPLSPETVLERASPIALSPDGNRVLARLDDGLVLFDPLSWRTILGPLPVQDFTHALFADDGATIVTIGPKSFQRFSAATGASCGTAINASAMNTHVLDVSSDGSRALIRGRSYESAQVINTFSGQPVSAVLDHPASIRLSGFAAEGRIIYTSTARSVFLWDGQTGDLLGPPLNHANDIDKIAIDTSGRRIAVFLSRFGENKSDLLLWYADQAMGDAKVHRLSAQVNSMHHVDALGGFIPLQPEQFDSSWGMLGPASKGNAREHADWRLEQLRHGDTRFARAFHLKWARTEQLASGEIDLAELSFNDGLTTASETELLERAVAKGVSSWSIYNKLASVYAQSGRWREAIYAYRKTLKLRRDEPQVWIDLAASLLQAGSPTEQDTFCTEMFNYFFHYDLYGTAAWNVTAGSCAFFPGKINVRPSLLQRMANNPPGDKSDCVADAAFYSALLYRENGIDSVANRLEIAPQCYVTQLLKALYLTHNGQTSDAQTILDGWNAAISKLYDYVGWQEAARLNTLITDLAAMGYKIDKIPLGRGRNAS
jgi:WD40 repeat protein/tetratricopeptide (TPR) repeat protein